MRWTRHIPIRRVGVEVSPNTFYLDDLVDNNLEK